MCLVTQLSIVIPATGTQEQLDQTLVSVLENRPSDCEVIVPHAFDYKDPYDLHDEVTFVGSAAENLVSLGKPSEGLKRARHSIRCPAVSARVPS